LFTALGSELSRHCHVARLSVVEPYPRKDGG
jgi:hypothetical protein